MQVSHLQTLSAPFSEFLKSRLNLEHLKKRDHTHSECISEITDFQKRC